MSSIEQQPGRSDKQTGILTANFQLPPEIWEHIFQYVPGFKLLRLRLICRHWNDVISGSPSLMARFYFRITGQEGRMDNDYVPPGLYPMVSTVLIVRCEIASVGPWLRASFKKLTELQLLGCEMTVEVLFGMLRQVPNLKRLVLFDSQFSGSGEPDFRMNQLESLIVNSVYYTGNDDRHILDGFNLIFPYVKDLVIGTDIESRKAEVLEWIRTLQPNLQMLQLPREPYIMEGLCQMKELRLKQASLNPWFPQDYDLWFRFCRMQPHQEILIVTTNVSEMLAKAGRLLPKLIHISIIAPFSLDVSFLEAMPRLKYLEISGILPVYCEQVFFREHSCPNMERFVLKKATTADLFQFLRRSPKLTRMHLKDCHLDCSEAASENLPSLRCMTLDNIHYPKSLMVPFLSRCLNLEELHLINLEYLDDDVVREFCQKLKHLKKLTLIWIRCVTDKSAQYIMQHCRVLEELSANFSDAALDRLEATCRNIRIRRP